MLFISMGLTFRYAFDNVVKLIHLFFFFFLPRSALGRYLSVRIN